MDGASKFVRGDAIAGILILVINLIGGLIVGILQHGMPVAAAAKTYTLLTIGDGLVAQIPALIISTAAGLVVSRVGTDQNMSAAAREPALQAPAGFRDHRRHHRRAGPRARHAALRVPRARGRPRARIAYYLHSKKRRRRPKSPHRRQRRRLRRRERPT